MRWLTKTDPVDIRAAEDFLSESLDEWRGEAFRYYCVPNGGAVMVKDDIAGAYWGIFYGKTDDVCILDAKTEREAYEEFDAVWEEWSAPDTREYDIPSVGARNRVVNGRVM